MSSGNNQQVDVLKKSLEMVDKFLEDRETELATFANFGIDTEPLTVLYKHFRQLIKEMLAAPSPREFHDMMMEIGKSIAGVLIIISPASAGQVTADMQGAHPTMDPNEFADFIKDINKHTQFKANPAPSTKNNEPVDPNNQVEDLLDMTGLKDLAKPGKKKKKSDDKADEEKPKQAPGKGFTDLYDKYK